MLLCVVKIAYCYCVRHRIKLAVSLLCCARHSLVVVCLLITQVTMTETSVEVSKHFPGMFVVASLWVVVTLLTSATWFCAAFFTIYEFNSVKHSAGGIVSCLGCYFLLTLYWICYVNMYIVHMTTSGVFGTVSPLRFY